MDGDGLIEEDAELDGDGLLLGLRLGEADEDGDCDELGLTLGETLPLGDADDEGDRLGETDGLGLTEAEGLSEGDGGVGASIHEAPLAVIVPFLLPVPLGRRCSQTRAS